MPGLTLENLVREIFTKLDSAKDREREFYTASEVAKRLRVRREAVIAWIRTGELDAVNVSRNPKRKRYRISPEAFRAFCMLRRATKR